MIGWHRPVRSMSNLEENVEEWSQSLRDNIEELLEEFDEWSSSVWSSVESWVIKHDMTIDLTTIWALSVGFALLCIVNIITWWSLKRQHDQTGVGRSLRGKKLSEAILDLSVSTLYSATLFAFYMGHQFTPLDRLIVRLLLIIGILGAVFHGVRFINALRKENWGRPDYQVRTTEMNRRDARQNAREISQDNRDTRWDEREKGHT
jgi:hypothetical protein